LSHVLFGKPVSTFPGHALISLLSHVHFGKPVSTFPGHALRPLRQRERIPIGAQQYQGSVNIRLE
jgi:hypothetical protein